MGRRGSTAYSVVIAICISCLALVPFTFFLINSLAPTHIPTISLAKITGKVVDPSTSEVVQVVVKVGPSGGCIWTNITNDDDSRCISHIPFKPTSEQLHLEGQHNENITSCFPVALGKALALNHVVTALMGISILAVLVDLMVLEGGASLAIIHFTVLFMWLTFILETVYISLLHKRLEDHDTEWEYQVGQGYWMILAATLLISSFSCGGNSSFEM
ncbi:uncharacterized protein IL334_006792 [Kwoniella shivajii]|uniref:Uncharacterized protein n=1 Tax=Kwoniella shivajii TaxID=564305 RepID=A0ABZ1D9Z2_9TREE|nr:hypothetical protein IL334_006792 [Kwoniella shivajii]